MKWSVSEGDLVACNKIPDTRRDHKCFLLERIEQGVYEKKRDAEINSITLPNIHFYLPASNIQVDNRYQDYEFAGKFTKNTECELVKPRVPRTPRKNQFYGLFCK